MIEKKTHRKLALAIAITKALDDPFDRLTKTYTVSFSEMTPCMNIDEVALELRVAIEFAQQASLAALISVFMHEARHWTLQHHRRWQLAKQDMQSWILPEDFLPDAEAVPGVKFKLWNIAADCEIYPTLSHIPIIRGDDSLRAGRWPCSKLRFGTAEQMLYKLVYDDEARSEALKYLRGEKAE
jgi:hypothetical protein